MVENAEGIFHTQRRAHSKVVCWPRAGQGKSSNCKISVGLEYKVSEQDNNARESGRESKNARPSKASEYKAFTVFTLSMTCTQQCFPHKAAVRVLWKNHVECLGRGQHTDVRFSLSFLNCILRTV